LSDRGKFQIIKGFRDILPPESALWNRVEQTAREIFGTFGFAEIRLPIFERTELFARSVGQETDIVSKEMYVLEDHELPDLAALRARLLLRDPMVSDSPSYEQYLKLLGDFTQAFQAALTSGSAPRTPDNQSALSRLDGSLAILTSLVGSHDEIQSRTYVDLVRTILASILFGDRITPRPEATASVVRAYISNGMKTWPQPVKLYYMGPMFRRERPQKGRYRQFYQIGAEVLGKSDSVAIDAEVIEMVTVFFDRLGLVGTTLYINSIGCKDCRPKYVDLLREELRKVKDQLRPDSQRRIETNPLRVLDSKVPEEQSIIENLPRITDHLCEDCGKRFAELLNDLSNREIPYKVNWRLVRGLDYYVRTTFEIIALGLGSQDAVCGGGRYDGLVELLGGEPTSGFGFAIGTDRLIQALGHNTAESVPSGAENLSSFSGALQRPDVAIAATSDETWDQAIQLASKLRKRGLSVFLPKSGAKLPRVFEAAQRIGVRAAILVGETEQRENKYTIRILSPLAPNEPRDVPVPLDEILLYGKIVKLRQDLEREVLRLAKGKPDLDTQRNFSSIVEQLTKMHVMTPNQLNEIKDLLPILNRAIHGKPLSEESREWVLAVGYLLLNELETLNPTKG
jgi:histidyl-tRNA synthetase